MKFRIDYTRNISKNVLFESAVNGCRILAASDWSDCVNKTKRMIDDGYKITGIAQAPEHIEVTPWVS